MKEFLFCSAVTGSKVSCSMADIIYYLYSAIKRETMWEGVMPKEVLGVSRVWQHPCCCWI